MVEWCESTHDKTWSSPMSSVSHAQLHQIWNIWCLTVLRSAFNGWRQQGRATRAARLRCCRTSSPGRNRSFCLAESFPSFPHQVWHTSSRPASHLLHYARTVGWSAGAILLLVATASMYKRTCWKHVLKVWDNFFINGDVVGSSILAHILLELPTVSYCILCLHASWPFANHVFVGWNCYEFFVHHRSSMIIIISLYMTILYHINEWKC